MAFPKNEKFDIFLRTVTRFNPNDSNYKEFIVSHKRVSINSRGYRSIIPENSIWYCDVENFTIDSLLKRIEEELRFKGHASNRLIASSIIMIFTYHNGKSENPIDALNEVFESITTSKAYQYYVLPSYAIDKPNESIVFKDFTIDLLNHQQLEYRCKKAHSDFYTLYSASLMDRVAIERKAVSANIINWLDIYKNPYLINDERFRSHLLLYFEYVTNALNKAFWDDFVEQQYFHVAFGVPYIDERALQEATGSTMVTIYLEIYVNGVQRGYVVPSDLSLMHITINPDYPKRVKQFYDRLIIDCGYDNSVNKEISTTLASVTKFISIGNKFLTENRKNEGFLHKVIALDLLFGGKEGISKSVSSRAAVLTYRKWNKTLSAQQNLIVELYNARSRYVHSGENVNDEYIDKIRRICVEVLMCILRFQKFSDPNDDAVINKWKRKLDYIYAALDIGKEVPDSELEEVGIDLQEHKKGADS